MIRAFQEIYLSDVQSTVGEMFDYAINVLNIPSSLFVNIFLKSSACKKIENGEPNYIVGKSGVEIASEVILETTGKEIEVKVVPRYERTAEYWIGWVASFYQWYSDRKYSEIFDALSIDDFYQLYGVLHEEDIMHVVDIIDDKVRNHFKETKLKTIRLTYGITQLELSKRSHVSLRSIQMYEQRNKDINKASANTIYSLAKALGCTMEDLVEK